MDAAEVTEVCRLCPSSGGGKDLLHVFDERLSVKNNMKEVILVTTGIEIQENDIISKKICHRCCNKTLQIFMFRQVALTQDRALKEKCSRFLEDKGIRLPNTCITIKRERRDSCLPVKRPKVEPDYVPPTPSKVIPKKLLHPSVADIYKNYAHIKLPKKCLDRNLAPVVSFTMGEVEKYFRNRKLEMKQFIYRPGIRKLSSNAVAKKRTSFPTKQKQKTVSPIKISKKVFENHEIQKASTNSDYVCTSVYKDKKEKKRIKSMSPPNSDKRSPSTMCHENMPVQFQSSEKLSEAPKLSVDKLTETLVVQPSNPAPQISQPIRTITPTPIDTVSEGSRGSYSSTTSKPEFIESLGLTPTVTATKSQTMHICNLCGSVHNNAFKLKTHSRKHMVCQFCKLRFKTIESKQDHVDNLCQVKEIMNSSGPIVELEKTHLNLTVRKKYRDAFSTFESIPGLVELDAMEQAIVKPSSPLPPLSAEDVILLSDDETLPTRSGDSLSVVPIPATDIVSPEAENMVCTTSSIVKPDVTIKDSTVLDTMMDNTTDKQLIRDLIVLCKPQRVTTVEKMLQTDFPASKDIKIHNAEGFCEFKNLKEQLLSYKIPVAITDGPFHVAYQYKNNSNSTKSMALWDDLPVIDVGKRTASKQSESRSIPQTLPLPINIPINNSQVQLPHISSSTPLMTTKNNTGLATAQNPISPRICNPSNKYMGNANTSNSKPPLLQNFTRGIIPSPAIKHMPIPKRNLNSSFSHTTSTPKRNMPSTSIKNSGNRSLTSSTLSRKSPAISLSKCGTPVGSVPVNRPGALANSVGASPLICTTNINSADVQLTINSAALTSKTESSVSETSRFRVKNVWELQ